MEPITDTLKLIYMIYHFSGLLFYLTWMEREHEYTLKGLLSSWAHEQVTQMSAIVYITIFLIIGSHQETMEFFINGKDKHCKNCCL